MKTSLIVFPFDLFGSPGAGVGAALIADEFREILADNRRETAVTRARVYTDKVRLREFAFDTAESYASWRGCHAFVANPRPSRMVESLMGRRKHVFPPAITRWASARRAGAFAAAMVLRAPREPILAYKSTDGRVWIRKVGRSPSENAVFTAYLSYLPQSQRGLSANGGCLLNGSIVYSIERM